MCLTRFDLWLLNPYSSSMSPKIISYGSCILSKKLDKIVVVDSPSTNILSIIKSQTWAVIMTRSQRGAYTPAISLLLHDNRVSSHVYVLTPLPKLQSNMWLKALIELCFWCLLYFCYNFEIVCILAKVTLMCLFGAKIMFVDYKFPLKNSSRLPLCVSYSTRVLKLKLCL